MTKIIIPAENYTAKQVEDASSVATLRFSTLLETFFPKHINLKPNERIVGLEIDDHAIHIKLTRLGLTEP